MRNRIMWCIFVSVMFAFPLFGTSHAQETADLHVVYDAAVGDDHSVTRWIWLFDGYTSNVTMVAELHREWGGIPDWIIDLDQQRVYFIEVDTNYGPLGASRLVQYDWASGARQVVFDHVNIAHVRDHPDPDKLILWYYAADTITANKNTLLHGCLLSVRNGTCRDFADGIHESTIGDWVWLNDEEVLRFNTPTSHVSYINIETEETIAVSFTPSLGGGVFWQQMSTSPGIIMFLRSDAAWTAEGYAYDLYCLDIDTFEIVWLSSIDIPFSVYWGDYWRVSPDGRYLAIDQHISAYEWHEEDYMRIWDVESGQSVYNRPLTINGPSGQRVRFIGDIRWTSNSRSVLRVASVIGDSAWYVVRIDVASGLVTYITTLEGDSPQFLSPLSIRHGR